MKSNQENIYTGMTEKFRQVIWVISKIPMKLCNRTLLSAEASPVPRPQDRLSPKTLNLFK